MKLNLWGLQEIAITMIFSAVKRCGFGFGFGFFAATDTETSGDLKCLLRQSRAGV